MDDPAINLGAIECSRCPLGQASCQDAGQFCPFILRHFDRGEFLCRAGDPAEYVWFVKEGVIGLSQAGSSPDRLYALRLPGSYVGLELLLRSSYLYTARALSAIVVCGAPRAAFRRWMGETDERLAVVLRAALNDPILIAAESTSP